MTDMGTFRITVEIENPLRPGERRAIPGALVDTGAELSWLPEDVLEALGIERSQRRRFRQASGAVIERWVGLAWVHVAGKRCSDDVVFAESGDLTLLGARSLEGMNLMVHAATRQLLDAGPVDAAAA